MATRYYIGYDGIEYPEEIDDFAEDPTLEHCYCAKCNACLTLDTDLMAVIDPTDNLEMYYCPHCGVSFAKNPPRDTPGYPPSFSTGWMI